MDNTLSRKVGNARRDKVKEGQGKKRTAAPCLVWIVEKMSGRSCRFVN